MSIFSAESSSGCLVLFGGGGRGAKEELSGVMRKSCLQGSGEHQSSIALVG